MRLYRFAFIILLAAGGIAVSSCRQQTPGLPEKGSALFILPAKTITDSAGQFNLKNFRSGFFLSADFQDYYMKTHIYSCFILFMDTTVKTRNINGSNYRYILLSPSVLAGFIQRLAGSASPVKERSGRDETKQFPRIFDTIPHPEDFVYKAWAKGYSELFISGQLQKELDAFRNYLESLRSKDTHLMMYDAGLKKTFLELYQ